MSNQDLDFLSGLEFFGIKLGLKQTEELFRRLGNPEKNLRFIHVAGSNGKGSVCALLESSFRHAGLKTGFYSSPHLVRVGERFKVNGKDATDEDVADCIRILRPVIADMEKDGMKVTYFEATTAIAALLFLRAGTDIVLWETGMGGRLDATNIVTPLASVITGISMEHARYLGNTISAIAGEKAGIIKPGVPVFCARQTPPEAVEVIRKRADELNAPFFYSAEIADDMPVEHQIVNGIPCQKFSLKDGTILTTPLAGPHQRNNAALAYRVLAYLGEKLDFDFCSAAEGFCNTVWQARFQVFSQRKLVLDGAHNPEGLQMLAATLKEMFPNQKFHLLFGAFSDKDTMSGLAAMVPLALSFRFIHMDTMRASSTEEELASQLRTLAPDIPADGMSLEQALRLTYPDGEWRVLCGSLHLCGEALPYLTL